MGKKSTASYFLTHTPGGGPVNRIIRYAARGLVSSLTYLMGLRKVQIGIKVRTRISMAIPSPPLTMILPLEHRYWLQSLVHHGIVLIVVAQPLDRGGIFLKMTVLVVRERHRMSVSIVRWDIPKIRHRAKAAGSL